MNIHDLNRVAWDQAVDEGTNPSTQVVSTELVAKAKQGRWTVRLSSQRPVPFVITGFFEDRRTEEDGNPIRHYMPSDFVVCARKERSIVRKSTP